MTALQPKALHIWEVRYGKERMSIAFCAALLALLLASASAVASLPDSKLVQAGPKNGVRSNFDDAPFSQLGDASQPLDLQWACGAFAYNIATESLVAQTTPSDAIAQFSPAHNIVRAIKGEEYFSGEKISGFEQAMAWVDVITSFVPGAGKLITKPIGWALKGLKGGAGIVVAGAFRLAERAGGRAGVKFAGKAGTGALRRASKKITEEISEGVLEEGGKRVSKETGRIGRVVLSETLENIGEWAPGSQNIFLKRSFIREASLLSGRRIGQELQIHAYHEAFHRGVYRIDRLVGRLLGVDDIYAASLDAFRKNLGRGIWYRGEERVAQAYGSIRMLIRQHLGIR